MTTQPHLPWSWRVTKYLLDAFLILMVATQLEKVFHVLKTEGVADVRAFNGRLVNAVHNFSPFTLGENFAYRLDSEHGRRVLSFRAPFNMTAARARVDARFPRAARRAHSLIDIDVLTGKPIPEDLQREIADYKGEIDEINRSALPDWMPRFVEKIIALPDASMFTVWKVFAGGKLSLAIGLITLLIALRVVLKFGPLAVLVLPVLTPLLAWLLFLPVSALAWLLNVVVVHVIGVPLTAPETTVVMTGGASFPISWATQKIVEHVVTDRTLRAFHKNDE